ncbi:hypothetical protein [Kocuria flava]|nr:hypothetical protein [Kocuria flava]
MFETWEWWQWLFAGVGLVVCWAFVGFGWLLLTGGGGEAFVGGALGIVGAIGACWTTTALMRHMPEQWGSVVLGLVLGVLALVLTFWFLGSSSWPVTAVLAGGTFIAFLIDAINRHLASIPMSPALLFLGVFLVLGLAFGSTQRR